MNKAIIIVISLFILAVTAHAFACPREPYESVIKNQKSFLKETDIVFLGQLVSFEELSDWQQLAVFSIKETFKGPELNAVTIINELSSSCSRSFAEKGADYYVFARLDVSDGNYVIKGFATFIPVSELGDGKIDFSKLD